MVSVRINGDDSSVGDNENIRVTDLVELIKTSIDPEHMITSLLVNGRELSEEDWTVTVSQLGEGILEVQTGTPEDYVTSHLDQAPNIIENCFIYFRDARKSFQEGKMLQGNQRLVNAVKTLKAFFEWYSTLMELATPERRKEIDISNFVGEISEICKRICQQQLYQSWWALGETISKELEPKLDQLEDHLRKYRAQI